ncbi:vWA domain-containing protein [Novosphingobium album (ex Hu et al. 2023)]|uniref:VWA domain-containing protein n=1 Tax=Novosphingobium album (ex Hu et al. 2023) TaxID=2930093 RepID=A0ABT0AZ80_9SPHN|nr:VWA domain-containing protein [Novosphingobium album (ex Hu et al. 2023)]MCJ2177988.1 VWA domain-containing protein [Novosphingobium album (ex Hu et al. 2023)]
MGATISRTTVSTLLGMALTGSSMPLALTPVHASARASEEGFCRRPAPLPELGPEVEGNQQQRHRPSPRHPVAEGVPAVTTPAPPPPPPAMAVAAPPAPAPVIVPTGKASDVAVTAMRAPSSEAERARESVTMPFPPGHRRPQPQPQSGLLTAGEHDDLLNPELYSDYVRKSDLGQQVRALPALDTARLITVEVKDTRGRPAPFVPVTLRCADGNSLTFTTQADGTVVFFPGMDRLSSTVRVRAGDEAWRTVEVPRRAGTGRIGFTVDAPVRKVTKLDLGLVVDVTGSMSDELRFLQAELDSIVASLNARHPDLDIRVGMTFYRDKGDAFVTRTYGFTGDIAEAREQLGRQYAGGGGDYPESMQDALIRAANQQWRPDAVKTLLLVADAPPHDGDVPTAWLAAEHLRAQRVQIVPVGASGVADLAEYVMRAMAAATQSRYAFLTDDSGIGNPHAPPAIDCYLVTRLDKLLTRIIDSQVSGRRIEPDKAEVIREVGHYDAGKCVLPEGFGKET